MSEAAAALGAAGLEPDGGESPRLPAGSRALGHELLNALTPLLGYCEMALESLQPDDPARVHVTRARVAAYRALDAIRRLRDERPGTPTEPPRGTRSPGAPIRVLLVEDDPAMVAFAAAILRHRGHEVHAEQAAAPALAAFRSRPCAFDVVVTDRLLGDMTGERLARELRQVRPEVPIVLMSGAPDDDACLVADAFVGKPFDARELDAAVRRAVEARA